jgi:hypothetical protein
MIVKVEDYREHDAWVLVDNIRSVGKFVCSDVLNEPSGINDINMRGLPEGNMEKPRYVALRCVGNDGKEFYITFDTTAYICNDEGKTIERVVANGRIFKVE